MKPATSNLASSCGLLRPIIISHQKKMWCGPGLGELPKIWGFPVNNAATARACDYKFCILLGFAKTYKIMRLCCP